MLNLACLLLLSGGMFQMFLPHCSSFRILFTYWRPLGIVPQFLIALFWFIYCFFSLASLQNFFSATFEYINSFLFPISFPISNFSPYCNVVLSVLGFLTSLFSSSHPPRFSFACVFHFIMDLQLYWEGMIRDKWVYVILSEPEALLYSFLPLPMNLLFFQNKKLRNIYEADIFLLSCIEWFHWVSNVTPGWAL